MAARISARLILFFISSPRRTRKKSYSSFCKLHFPRYTATSSKKQSAVSSPRNPRNTRKSEFYYEKISSVSTKKCGAQMLFNWEGRWSHHGRVSSDFGKQSIHIQQDPHLPSAPNWDGGPGVGTHKTHSEITIVASATHTETNSQQQVVLGFLGECCLSTSSLLCLSSAVSLIVLGMKPRPLWIEVPTVKRYSGNSQLQHNGCTE